MKRLLTVLLILAMLSAGLLALRRVFPGYTVVEITQREWTKAAIDNYFARCLARFKTDTGRYPATREGLQALLVAPDDLVGKWRGPYLKSFPTDPWHRRYWYKCPGIHNPNSYDLWSLGPDKVLSHDDIGNW